MIPPDFPIIDLHCHFEGSIDPELSYEILHRHGHPAAQEREEFFANVTGYTPGQEGFFDAISLLDMCLLDGPSVQAVATDFINRAAAQNVKILEFSVAPRIFMLQDPQTARLDDFMEAIFTAVETSAAQHDIAVGQTMMLRSWHYSERFCQTSGDINEIILRYQDYITGVDLCTLDFLDENPEFETQLPGVCEIVKDAGLHLSAHAGEFYDARPVEKALELGVERIGHGIRIIHDREVMEQVIEQGVTLEVCPVSNYKTGALAPDEEHPLRKLLHAGVRVTINSDDQGVQASTWRDDYDYAMHTLGLTEEEIKTCLRNSFEASFLPAERIESYRELFVGG